MHEVRDIEICRLSDTAPKRVWQKSDAPAPRVARFGYLTYQGLTDGLAVAAFMKISTLDAKCHEPQEILGCRPPEVETDVSAEGQEWKLAQSRYLSEFGCCSCEFSVRGSSNTPHRVFPLTVWTCSVSFGFQPLLAPAFHPNGPS